MAENLRINGERLLARIEELASIGAIDGGGSCRLALTDEDRAVSYTHLTLPTIYSV